MNERLRSWMVRKPRLSVRERAAAPRSVSRYFPFFVLAGAFVWSAVTIVTARRQESPPGTITLHISHWQLETGVKDALDLMARRYQELHPDVRVVQNIIPESAYGTWLTTNLLGGTAPDMVEIPDSSKLPHDVMISYYSRYFVPMTPCVSRLNPYNKGTDLENVPLRRTYKDGMRGSYIQELQDYMHIPLSLFGVRIFYNKDLYRRLTGKTEPPQDYREFLAVCEKIKSQQDAQGRNYIPICAANDSMWAWESQMFDPLSYTALRKVDFDRDGFASAEEVYAAFKTGLIDFQHPAYKARYQITWEVTAYFPLGFTGLARDDSVFQFAQQRGVFLSTGTWDARSLIAQADGTFEIGVMDFPMPRSDDPAYGAVVAGPCYEGMPEGGFPVGITRTSPHQDVALDFLFFMAGRKQNEELNRVMGWIPITVGASMEPFYDAFAPRLEGVYSALSVLGLGGETRSRYQQLYTLYQSHQISYEDFVAQFAPFYKQRGQVDFEERERDWRRDLQRNEYLLGSMRAEAMTASGNEAASRWVRYRAMIAARQVLAEINQNRKVRLVADGPASRTTAPYEYSPEVLAKIRERLHTE